MDVYQIILIVISGIFLYQSLVRYVRKERSQTFIKFVVSVCVWGGILLFALFPGEAREFSRLLGLGDNLNTLIFIGFVVVFALIFRILRSLEKSEQNITELVRNDALKDLKK